jgi:hypothetical protein
VRKKGNEGTEIDVRDINNIPRGIHSKRLREDCRKAKERRNNRK